MQVGAERELGLGAPRLDLDGVNLEAGDAARRRASESETERTSAAKLSAKRKPTAEVSAAVLAELRAWAGAEDAAESERKSVRSENLDSALCASTGSSWSAAAASGSKTRRECSELSAKRKPTA